MLRLGVVPSRPERASADQQELDNQGLLEEVVIVSQRLLSVVVLFVLVSRTASVVVAKLHLSQTHQNNKEQQTGTKHQS